MAVRLNLSNAPIVIEGHNAMFADRTADEYVHVWAVERATRRPTRVADVTADPVDLPIETSVRLIRAIVETIIV